MKLKPAHFGPAVLLSTAVLAAPVLAGDLSLRPALTPVFWILALVSFYLIVTWPLRWVVGHWLLKTLAALVLLGVGGSMLAVSLAAMASETPESLPLADGCRAEVDVVGGFGDTDHHVLHRCAVAGLWQRSTPLQSDTEAVLQRLRAAAPSTDGALQIAVTRARYGQPDEQLLLRIPPR